MKHGSSAPVGRVLHPLALVGLGAGTVLAFALLSPLSERREQEAREAAPDLVSLSYLRLNLQRRPEDRALRFQLSERLLAAGLLDEASALCAPLAAQADRPAQRLALEIDYRRWLALDPRATTSREQALQRIQAGLQSLLGTELHTADVERLAEICVATGQLGLRARFWSELARRALDEPSVARADAAYLELQDPLAAAELWAALALAGTSPQAASHAVRALERARSADQPARALALFERLSPRFGRDAAVQELGLSIAAGLDDRRALAIAEHLHELRPLDAALQQQLLRLRAWTRPAPARRAPEPSRPDREQELAQARADWDLGRVLELTPARSEQRAELEERVSLLEALGRVSEALATLDAALAGDFAGDAQLWGRELALQLAVGQIEAGLGTLTAMEQRFGLERKYVAQHADLLLSLGRGREALALLSRLPQEEDPEHTRRVIQLAWELGEPEHARQTLESLVRSPGAEARDFEQLWRIYYEAQSYRSALSTAERGYQHFPTARLLRLSIDAALAVPDEPAALELLTRAEAEGSPLAGEPQYPLWHAQLLERGAQRAFEAGDLALARQHSERAGELLEQAERAAPEAQSYSEERQAQRRQALALALEASDLTLVAALYPGQAPQLGARDRVQVLSRLGRYEQAAGEAVAELEAGATSGSERDGLESETRTLGSHLPRQLWIHGAAEHIPELFSLSVGGGAQYAFSSEFRLGAAADLTEFSASAAGIAEPATAEPWSSDDPTLEVALRLRATLGSSALALGVRTRADGPARPFASFEQQLLEQRHTRLTLRARANDAALETAPLRLYGAEDQLTVLTDIGLGDQLYLSANAAGQAYWLHDRSYLGVGATLNAGLGYHLPVGASLGTANVRLSGYLAPRFAADPTAGFVPDGTSWFGLGASFARGQLDLPPLAGRTFALLTDASLGWILPQQELGWSGRLGLGFSLLGADLFSLSMQGSNVLGTAPGFAAYTLSAEYRLSQWQ